MDESPLGLPADAVNAPDAGAAPDAAEPSALPDTGTTRARVTTTLAALQVVALCGVPTQILLTGVLWGLGVPLYNGSDLSLEFVALVSLLDTALVAALVRTFLVLGGESPSAVLAGTRPPGREALLGIGLVPLVLLGTGAVVLTLRAIAPVLHNVTTNPLEALMRTPVEAAIFLVVVVLAGGLREELARAFILHRFEQRLGGARLGLVLFSAVFGLLHYTQGIDVAIALGLLGLFWGLLYLRRRSMIASAVSHAGFNAAQVVQVVVARSLGL